MPTTYELNMPPEVGATSLVGTLPTAGGTVSNTWPDVTSATFVEGSTASRNGPATPFKVA